MDYNISVTLSDKELDSIANACIFHHIELENNHENDRAETLQSACCKILDVWYNLEKKQN